MTHHEYCPCFECFCEKQKGRIIKQVNRPTHRRRAITGAHRQRLKLTHAEMIVNGHKCALPNLDYYDGNRDENR